MSTDLESRVGAQLRSRPTTVNPADISTVRSTARFVPLATTVGLRRWNSPRPRLAQAATHAPRALTSCGLVKCHCIWAK